MPEIAISIVAELIARRNVGLEGASAVRGSEAPGTVEAGGACDAGAGGSDMIAAVVPAAGLSQRMGRPKLLLPLHGQTLIARVVTALREGGADRVVVVAPPDDSEEGPAVAARSTQAPGHRWSRPRSGRPRCVIRSRSGWRPSRHPTPPTHVLLAPGDAAGITPRVVALLVEASSRQPERIVVPRCGGAPRAPAGAAVEARRGDCVAAGRAGAQRHSWPGFRRLWWKFRWATRGSRTTSTRPEDLRRWEEQEDDRTRRSSWRRSIARGRAGRPQSCEAQILRAGEGARGVLGDRSRAGAGSHRVSDLRAEIARRLPGLAPLMKNVMIAMNEEYADDEAQILPGARIAVIPPVSGGAGGLAGSAQRANSAWGFRRP